ncbi:hypothetical protein CYLTODRAFT_493435 [Cylindrobasidium torrendii FP15055 ss-10]|uniref:F-box domain-containing protein n=1 Tax=Cylindrobasidium torrendii FP15055 ss-10 TaxID=1314674 RepID=A0A0D7B082_9AGAR|nr:hypothetical protein CYLTODRAFT_493435 [Cylindrobasidium torrendii FP15055 ss-10]
MNAIRDGSGITLPEELVFMILEAAAALYPHTASRLLFLSRAACLWFEPFVYHTVVLRSMAQSDRFMATVKRRRLRDPEFFQRNVRVIICKIPGGQTHDGALEQVLQACSHVVHVSCAAAIAISQSLPADALRSLRYLNVHGDHIPSSPTVTHLVLRQSLEQIRRPALSMMRRLRCFPNLTHMCLNVKLVQASREVATGVLEAVLLDRPHSLQRIVVVFQFGIAWTWGAIPQYRIINDVVQGRTTPICFAVFPASVEAEVMMSPNVIRSRDVAAVLGWDIPSADTIWTRAEAMSSSASRKTDV